MTTTTFVDYQTPAVNAAWLNNVNDVIYDYTINVKVLGATGDGLTNDQTAFDAARDAAAALSAAGNVVRVVFPPGRYVYTTSPNWAIDRLHMVFQGEVWLVNTGTGPGILLDGGASGDGVFGLRITGYPLIYGDADTTHGIYMRAVHRSHIEVNCRGAGTSYSGLYMEWGVSNTMFFIMNFNEGGLYSTPARGITLTARGVSEESSYNHLFNIECSGLPLGVYLDGALGNVFHGGAIQANTNGTQLTANAWNNKFIGVDWEENSGYDVTDAARETQYIGCDFADGPIMASGAVNCSFIGGITENITINSGALRTLLSGIVYNRFGAGTITDSGTATRRRDLRNKGSGLVENMPISRTELVVGASPYTYTNSTGNPENILVYGGTVSQITLTRSAGDALGVTAGQFLLSPGDAITVTYSSLPAVVKYTL